MGLDFFGVSISADLQVFAGGERNEALGVAGIPFTDKAGKTGLTYDLWLESQSPEAPNNGLLTHGSAAPPARPDAERR